MKIKDSLIHEPIKLQGFKTFVLTSVCCCLFLLMLFTPSASLNGARAGLTLCAEVVIPSLFPFLVLSSFVINSGLAQKTGRLFEPLMRMIFKLPGSAAAALILGLIGGYPVGAKACADLCKKGSLTKSEANRLLAFCINSSPAYIIGAVGAGLLGSTQAGLILYGAHVISSLLIGFLTGFISPKKPDGRSSRPAAKGSPVSAAFVGAVTGSAISIINICAFVVLFSSLSSLISGTGLSLTAAHAINAIFRSSAVNSRSLDMLIKGFLEVSNGCAGAASSSGLITVALISVFLSWSGLSVIFQIIYTVRDAGLSVKNYLMTRAFHIILSVALTILFFGLFPVAVPTFATASGSVLLSFHSAPASAALLVICALLLLSMVSI